MAAYTYEAITVADTAIGLTVAEITKSETLYGRPVKKVVCTLETGPIRFTVDGTTPTSTVGHLANIGDTIVLQNEDEARKFLAIRTTSTSGALKCTFEM